MDFCRRRAWWVVIVTLLLVGGCGFYAARHLGFDSNTENLLSPDLPWKQRQAALNELFPENKNVLLVVLDGPDGASADQAARDLAARLQERGDVIASVRRPDGGAFFEQNGLLFLSSEKLQDLADRLIAAQGLIGPLAADPSLRGLFGTLDLALEGVARGETDFASLEAPLAALADTLQASLQGDQARLSWQALIGGTEDQRLRRFLLVKPVLDFSKLRRGKAAATAIREEAESLGLAQAGVTLRLTGDVALADDEFATVSEGATVTTLLSFSLVTLILLLALRSWRIIVPILLTLVLGIVVTGAFAAVAVGKLNLLSVAFAVLFIGLAVDFGIQFAVRYRDERFRVGDFATALRRTASGVGGALLLAAGATAVDFFSFLPTDYRGISELGLIAGTSMAIGLWLTLTFLPALMTLLKPPGEPEPAGYRWAAPLDAFLLQRRIWVLAAFGAVGLAAFAAAFALRFDYNPLSLKDPESESLSTLLDISSDPLIAPFTAEALAETPEAAAELAARFAALPEVERALTLSNFVPQDQDEKLDILAELALFMGPSLLVSAVPPPSEAQDLAALSRTALALKSLEEPTAQRLAALLEQAVAAPQDLDQVRQALTGGLAEELARLATALSAQAVTFDDLPADLRRAWQTDDGRVRVQIIPKGHATGGDELRDFVTAVRTVDVEVAGAAVAIVESGATMLEAFEIARALAVLVVILLLLVLLRRPLDVARVMLPLVVAALLTLGTMVVIDLPFNFANFIALPLLVGIGVAFDIYFVMNWRAGQGAPLQSPTARAVLFSALTTLAAFGSLALSPHPGTASLGLLLAIGLGWTLVSTLLFLPALLGNPPGNGRA